MGSDESRFNVLLIVRNKVRKQLSQITTLEERGEPKRIRTQPIILLTVPAIRFTASPNRLMCLSLPPTVPHYKRRAKQAPETIGIMSWTASLISCSQKSETWNDTIDCGSHATAWQFIIYEGHGINTFLRAIKTPRYN